MKCIMWFSVKRSTDMLHNCLYLSYSTNYNSEVPEKDLVFLPLRNKTATPGWEMSFIHKNIRRGKERRQSFGSSLTQRALISHICLTHFTWGYQNHLAVDTTVVSGVCGTSHESLPEVFAFKEFCLSNCW